MLNLEQLNAFVAAAEKGSFSAGARHIGKSQSAVSIGVSNLELDLGVNLFDRSTKYPKLTTQGERLYQQAKIILRQAQRMENYAMGVVEEVEDSLTIAIDPMVPLSSIDSSLEKLSKKYPYTQIKLTKLNGDALTQALLNGEVQISVNLPMKAVPDNLDFVTYVDLEWVCVCSPDSKFADMEMVDNETLIAERQITCTSMLENPILESMGKLSQDIWQAFDQDDVIRLVEQDLGWAFIPKEMLLEKQAMGTLIQFTPEFNQTTMHYCADLTWRSNLQLGPVARDLIGMLTK